MRFAILVLVVSCTPPSTRSPTVRTDAFDVRPMLAPATGRRSARIVVQGPGQLVRGEGTFHEDQASALDECSDLEVTVLDDRDGWLRIVERQTDVALALWVPAHYAGDVVTAKTPLLPEPNAVANVWLRPGAPVRVVERTAGHARVELRHLNDRASGWIDAAALGRTYTRLANEPAPPSATSRLSTTQPILDAPVASATSTFATAFGGPYERVGDRHGFTEVRYRSAWLDARGFVETSGIKPAGPTGMCEGMRNRFLVGAMLGTQPDDVWDGTLAMPAGTCFRARRDGPIVGVQRTAGSLRAIVDGSGIWARVVVSTTTFGSYETWVRVDGERRVVTGC